VVGQTGPTHAPIFTIAVQIDGQSYEGKGRTKKMAKHAAAELALRNIIQFRNTPEVHQAINTCQPVVPLEPDFTSDVTERDNHLVNAFKTLTQEPKNTSKFLDKGPVALINELYPGVVYNCISDNGESYAKFTISVTIDGETFEGTGPSKKLAKAAASKAALAKLRNVHSTSFCIPLPVRILPNFSNSAHWQEQMTLPQMLADKIGKLVNQKFSELIQSKPQHARRKVLAGIVQTKGQDAELICVTTGKNIRFLFVSIML
jgi:double stranded RNA-specific editase B